MKTYLKRLSNLLLFTGTMAIATAYGQNNTDSTSTRKTERSDTAKFMLGSKKILVINKKDSTSMNDTVHFKKPKKPIVKSIWSGFELGIGGYMTPEGSTTMPKQYDFLELNYGKSTTINFNFAEQHIKLYKNHIALTTGLGFQFNRYMFSKQGTLQSRSDSTWVIYEGVNYKKNALKSSYLTAPILLQFTSGNGRKKSFHLAAGLVGGYRLSSHIKQVYSVDGKKHQENTYDDYNLAPFFCSATVRAGYGKLNVFGTYGLTELFQKNKGPKLMPFTVGIALIH